MWPNPVKDQQYVQRVRKHTPSSLLRLVVAAACTYYNRDDWSASPYRIYTPWALSDIARVALTYGNEHRPDATERDLESILGAYDALDDPFLHDKDLYSFLLRKAGEQLTWQLSDYQMLARTIALFTQTATDRNLTCIKPGWEIDLLGHSLIDYVATAQIAWACARTSGGAFSPELWDTPDGEAASRLLTRETAVDIIDRHFATDVARFRADAAKVAGRTTNPQLRRYTYNPLRGRPILTGFGPAYFCPIPQLVWEKASPMGIYFIGVDHFNTQFAIDTGYLFEGYIGKNLNLINEVVVVPEVKYVESGSEARGVDWVVIFEDLVLLVEVKSAVPSEPVRLGTTEGFAEFVKKLEKAHRQIERSAKRIMEQHPAFCHIPNDRPMLGMVVTLEPYPVSNAGRFRDLLPTTSISTCIVSAEEIEALVTIEDASISRLLLDRANDEERSTWDLRTALQGHTHGRNAVLDAAWKVSPWVADELPFSGQGDDDGVDTVDGPSQG